MHVFNFERSESSYLIKLYVSQKFWKNIQLQKLELAHSIILYVDICILSFFAEKWGKMLFFLARSQVMHQNSFLKLYSLKTIIPSSESKGPGDFKNGQYFENQSKNLFLPNSHSSWRPQRSQLRILWQIIFSSKIFEETNPQNSWWLQRKTIKLSKVFCGCWAFNN